MRKFLGIIFLLLLTPPVFSIIYEPRDKSRVFSEIIMLRGKVDGPGEIKINEQAIKLEADNSFSCGLILHPGKNLVEVRRGEAKQRLRILRLVTFPDIEMLYDEKKHWARGQIVYLATLGIIEGEPDGNFHPGRAVTRGEFATWLARAKKLSLPALTEDVFFDVPKEHWRAPFIKAATAAGYITPYSSDTFGLDEPIARREAAEMAVRAEGLAIVSRISPLFKDVPKEEKGAEPIYTAWEKGLVIGVSKDVPVFDPARALTRAEAATLLSRFIEVQEDLNLLSNYEVGYDKGKLCKLNVPPEIVSFTIDPDRVFLGKVTTLKLRAQLASRETFVPISKVKVDLSKIGGLPDAEMYDDATHGDEQAGDLIYSLNISFTPDSSGEKFLRVTAVDKLSWEGKKESSLLVLE